MVYANDNDGNGPNEIAKQWNGATSYSVLSEQN